MSALTQLQDAQLASQSNRLPWSSPLRVAFRFCFLYFTLYCLLTQILPALIPIPRLEIPDLSNFAPIRQSVLWIAEHVFRYKQPVIFTGSGSGDKVFDWVLAACVLTMAIVGAAIWSALDRNRMNYDTAYKWFRVFLRFALAGQLFVYGLIKVFPMQMPFPYLTKLLEPFGQFSPMGVLWSSIGASPAYERFVGSAELLAGLLLVVPAASMLGALICVVDMIEVFTLNMTYDVPVKLFSFHLLLMAAFLLIPERSRIVRFCLPHFAIESSRVQRLFGSVRANRMAIVAQVIFGSLLFGANLYNMLESWSKWGGGAPKPAFYGIWNVDQMSIDGVVRAPLLTDYGRWRRVVFQVPQSVMFERMDDSFAGFETSYNEKQRTLTLTSYVDKKWKGALVVHRQNAGHMTLDGELRQHKVRMDVSLMDLQKFPLISRGFHWVQDYPFNN